MSSTNSSTSLVVLALLAIFLPPAVPLMQDGCSGHFFLNLLLTILGWFPGVLHAFWLIHRGPKRSKHAPNVIHVEHGQHYPQQHQQPAYPAQPPAPPHYPSHK